MTIGLQGSGLRVPGIFPTDTFDFGQMQEQLDFPDRDVPRWFGHALSLPLDSECVWDQLRPSIDKVRSGRRPYTRLSGNGGLGVG